MEDYPVLEQEDVIITEYEERTVPRTMWSEDFSYLGTYIAEKRNQGTDTIEGAGPEKAKMPLPKTYFAGLVFFYFTYLSAKEIETLDMLGNLDYEAPDKPIFYFQNLNPKFATLFPPSSDWGKLHDNDFSHWLKEWYDKQSEEPPAVDEVLEHRAFRKELRRLSKSHSQFPDKDFEILFWTCFDDIADAKSLKRILGLGLKARRYAIKTQNSITKRRVKFLNHKHQFKRTPWEQFLHNRAPGVDADLSGRENAKYIQLLPVAGLQILANNIEDWRAMSEAIKQGREEPRPNPVTT